MDGAGTVWGKAVGRAVRRARSSVIGEKLANRNWLACRHVDTSSGRLFRRLVFGQEMIFSFSVRHRWHFFDSTPYAGAFVTIDCAVAGLAPCRCKAQTCFASSVLCSYLSCRKDV